MESSFNFDFSLLKAIYNNFSDRLNLFWEWITTRELINGYFSIVVGQYLSLYQTIKNLQYPLIINQIFILISIWLNYYLLYTHIEQLLTALFYIIIKFTSIVTLVAIAHVTLVCLDNKTNKVN